MLSAGIVILSTLQVIAEARQTELTVPENNDLKQDQLLQMELLLSAVPRVTRPLTGLAMDKSNNGKSTQLQMVMTLPAALHDLRPRGEFKVTDDLPYTQLNLKLQKIQHQHITQLQNELANDDLPYTQLNLKLPLMQHTANHSMRPQAQLAASDHMTNTQLNLKLPPMQNAKPYATQPQPKHPVNGGLPYTQLKLKVPQLQPDEPQSTRQQGEFAASKGMPYTKGNLMPMHPQHKTLHGSRPYTKHELSNFPPLKLEQTQFNLKPTQLYQKPKERNLKSTQLILKPTQLMNKKMLLNEALRSTQPQTRLAVHPAGRCRNCVYDNEEKFYFHPYRKPSKYRYKLYKSAEIKETEDDDKHIAIGLKHFKKNSLHGSFQQHPVTRPKVDKSKISNGMNSPKKQKLFYDYWFQYNYDTLHPKATNGIVNLKTARRRVMRRRRWLYY